MTGTPTTSTSAKSLFCGTLLTLDNNDVWEMTFFPTILDEQQATQVGGTVTILDTTRAKRLLMANVSDDVKVLFIGKTTPQAMWDALIAEFAGQNDARKLRFLKQVCNVVFYDTETMKQNLMRMERILRDLTIAAQSTSITIAELGLAMMINALPEAYGPVRTILEGTNDLTWEIAKARIEAEEQSRTNQFDGFAGGSWKGGKDAVVFCTAHGKRRPKAKCFICHPILHPTNATCKDCGVKGHFSKDLVDVPSTRQLDPKALLKEAMLEWQMITSHLCTTRPLARCSSPTTTLGIATSAKHSLLRMMLESSFHTQRMMLESSSLVHRPAMDRTDLMIESQRRPTE